MICKLFPAYDCSYKLSLLIDTLQGCEYSQKWKKNSYTLLALFMFFFFQYKDSVLRGSLKVQVPLNVWSYLTLSWPARHMCPTHKESFQVHWDNSIPLFLHASIYLEVSLFHWTSENAFSHETVMYKWYCVQCCMQHYTQ